MESGFSWEGRALSRTNIIGTPQRASLQLMHSRGYAVAVVGLDRGRAAGESAEKRDGYDERK
jgi:hypothetical protein